MYALIILLIKTPVCTQILAMHIYTDLQGLPNDRTHAVD